MKSRASAMSMWRQAACAKNRITKSLPNGSGYYWIDETPYSYTMRRYATRQLRRGK